MISGIERRDNPMIERSLLLFRNISELLNHLESIGNT
jgi:hypothetical protein